MGFSRQECWSGLPFLSPGDLPNPGIKPGSPALQADTLPSEPPLLPKYIAKTMYIILTKIAMWQISKIIKKKSMVELGLEWTWHLMPCYMTLEHLTLLISHFGFLIYWGYEIEFLIKPMHLYLNLSAFQWSLSLDHCFYWSNNIRELVMDREAWHLRSVRSQRVGHNWVTSLHNTIYLST